MITRVNTVIVPVQTSPNGGVYGVRALNGKTGGVIWQATSDFTLPSHDWVPIFGITLTPKDHYLAYPGAGGSVYIRTFPDSRQGKTTQYAFVNGSSPINGSDHYSLNKDEFDSHIQICTPISSDALGNLYFGFVSDGMAPAPMAGVQGGLAKISNTGVGSFVAASAIVGDASILKVAYNCAPAFSADGSTVYVAVNNSNQNGYLCALSTTATRNAPALTTKSFVKLLDPSNGSLAAVDDDGSGTPTIGPDGDVYYGVLASNISGNHYRGYLLHFDSTLNPRKFKDAAGSAGPPSISAFGWDDTPSIVPASAVPSYTGGSSYLLLSKYNNYAGGAGGNGINQVAIVDPNVSMVDPISGLTVMKTVITVTGVTPDADLGGFREWCINSAAIDLVNKCAVINSEDGHVYRWDFTTNSLSAGLMLEPATSEAYTPTVIGPDGAVYAINNAYLFSAGAAAN